MLEISEIGQPAKTPGRPNCFRHDHVVGVNLVLGLADFLVCIVVVHRLGKCRDCRAQANSKCQLLAV